jgi:LPPG:FO 2-phospho-L-lactate transferase
LKVVALAGGTGSAKLLRGLSRLPIDLTVVGNVGDNIWMYGVYVCPDVDIACYTLAGIASPKGWGLDGDTFDAMSSLDGLGLDTWFRLGDKDLATCLARTEMMRNGATLTEATDSIRKRMGVKQTVLPVTDDQVETRIINEKLNMHLQEFWVKNKGRPTVKEVDYKGSKSATVTKAVTLAIEAAERIIVCPANPVTSIGPMLSVRGFAQRLEKSSASVTAVSPMQGKAPFNGPALKLMKATGVRGDSFGVAQSYSKFIDAIIISERDSRMKKEIESLGVRCRPSNTHMETMEDEIRLAKEVLAN